MLLNGVAMMGQMGGPAFMVSSAHSQELIDQSVDAFSQALKDLGQEGAL
jgi:hypothetical protein